VEVRQWQCPQWLKSISLAQEERDIAIQRIQKPFNCGKNETILNGLNNSKAP
jgi:hypothetical protein